MNKFSIFTLYDLQCRYLFFGQHSSPLAPAEIDAELALMQALAEVAAEEEEDEQPDNGEIEILSEDEYVE